MIKRTTGIGEVEIVTYICDFCVKEMPGAAILVYYPYGHCNDSLDGPSHFCSDTCLIKFEQKMKTRFGDYKSTPLAPEAKVRTSADYRKSRLAKVEAPPKARRATKKRTSKESRKPHEPTGT